jgi:meiotic recombination protein SPO11
MDIDFIPGDGHAVFPGQLLSNLPDRRQTLDNPPNDCARQHANSQPLTQSRATNPNQAGMVITKIEDIFESIADCILDEKKELVIQLKSRVKPENRASQHESLVAKKRAKSDVRKITFPSRSPQEAWKFSRLPSIRMRALLTSMQLHYCGFLNFPTRL